jgi:hypothetical protein
MNQTALTLGALLPAVLRWLVLVSATVLVLSVAWLILGILWAQRDESSVSVQPFLVVDSSGTLKNGENGFAQMLVARIDDLQARVRDSQAVLERAQTAQSLIEEKAAQLKYGAALPESLSYTPLLDIVADHRIIQPVPFELKFQGIDVSGFFSWITVQLAPKTNSLSFTLHIGDDGVALAGDIRALKIAGVNTIWIAPVKESPVQLLNSLALQLYQLKLAEQNPYLRDFSAEEFGQLIDHLSAFADRKKTLRSEAAREQQNADLYGYFSGVVIRFDNWPALTTLVAQTARDAGNYQAALKYLNIAREHEEQLSGSERDAGRLALLNATIANIGAALAAQSQGTAASAGVVPETVYVRNSAEKLDTDSLRALRAGFKALYDAKGNESYMAIAGLYGVPGWYSWRHQQNARSAAQLRLFLPWQRAFLLHFEKAARSHISQFGLACWDWTQGGIPEIFTEKSTPEGNANPLLQAFIDLPTTNPPIRRNTSRSPGEPGYLPRTADVANVLSQSEWPDFSDSLEALSDRVHGWTSGDMGVMGTSAYDPLYYAVECTTDRIWARWQESHPDAMDPKMMDVELVPFGFKVRDVLDIRKLGYNYEKIVY